MKKLNTREWFCRIIPKFDLKMKFTLFFLLIALFQVQANSGYSQKTRISLNLNEASLSEVLAKIEDQTEFKFFYKNEEVDLNRKLTIKAEEKSISDILDEVFQNSDLDYVLLDKQIVLIKTDEATLFENQENVSITITGKVTDTEGKPLPGATILIKGTFKGITTNADGEYSITVPNSKTILVFSYVGFAKQEILVGNKVTINVTLEQAAMELEGVTINAGYYTVKEKEKTGNISRIDAKQIDNQVVTTPLQALQGRMPGVNITEYSGIPGGGIRIQIRGRNSLRYDGNSPLYVINGVPYASAPLLTYMSGQLYNSSILPINYINPSDIESVEILKDGDATAIYGSRGANGVVLITTKQGTASEKTAFTIDHSTGWGWVPKKLDVLNTEQLIEMFHEALANDGYDEVPAWAAPFFAVATRWDPNRNVDWQERLIGGTSERSNTQLTLSGGNSHTNYLFNGSYYRETTVYPGDHSLQRGSGLLNVNHQSKDQKFKASFSANYVYQYTNMPREDLTSSIMLPPNAPEPLDEEGNINFAEYGTITNPYMSFLRPYNSKIRNLVTNASFSYELFPAFNIKLDLGYTNLGLDEMSLIPKTTLNPAYSQKTGSSSFGDGRNETWILEPQLEYKKEVGGGVLSLLGGSSFQSSTNEIAHIVGYGYTSDALLANINAAPNVYIASSDLTEYKYYALFGRINYNFKDKYIFNLTGRRDGSSRFGPGKQFASFGAAGFSWIFSNESFIKRNFDFLSFGKLRSSYGVTGSDQIGNYEYLETYQATRFPFLGSAGLKPTRLANPEFAWETVRKFEIALELGFFKEKLYLGVSYYKNRSSNQLVGLPLAATTGFSSIRANWDATVQNKGFELEISSQNIQTKDFQWTTNFNISFERNKLISFPGIEGTSYNRSYTVGESMFNLKGLRYIGVNPETGLWDYEDVNGDGKISSPEDLQPIYDIAVDYYGGINNSIRYKGLQLDFFLQFKKQKRPGYPDANFIQPGWATLNHPAFVLDRWQKPGDITDIQKYSIFDSDARNADNNAVYSRGTNALHDASYIRLQSVTLAYNFPEKITNKLGLESLRLYVQGQNLFTITDYYGFDPNMFSVRNLPPLRFVTAGINVQL